MSCAAVGVNKKRLTLWAKTVPISRRCGSGQLRHLNSTRFVRCRGRSRNSLFSVHAFEEGIEVYQKALGQLDEKQASYHAAIGRLLTSQGWLYARTGQFEQAEQNAERAEALLLSPLEPSSNQSEMLNLRGAILGMMGHYAKSKTYFERAILVAQSVGEERYAAYYLNNLAISEKELGHYEQAESTLPRGPYP